MYVEQKLPIIGNKEEPYLFIIKQNSEKEFAWLHPSVKEKLYPECKVNVDMDMKGRLSPFILTPSSSSFAQLMFIIFSNISYDDGKDKNWMVNYE